MMVRQNAGVQRVAEVDGQYLDGVAGELVGDESLEVPGDLQPAEPGLDGDLPPTCRGEEQLVATISDDLPCLLGEPGVVGDPPQESVRIEQNPQRSKASRTSSGSEASKSSPIITRPDALPDLRRSGFSPAGTSRATGLPAFEITTSSPSLTRSSNRERCVLASWTFTVLVIPY